MKRKKAYSWILVVLTATQVIVPSAAFSQSSSDNFQIRHEDPSIKQGGVYYTYNKKDEVLFKMNIWGSVQYPGVHFLPLGTHFLDAVSIAGGPLESANTDDITLSSKKLHSTVPTVRTISINQALANTELNPVLQPDDIIFVRENRSLQKASVWLAAGTFLLTAASFGVLVSRH